MGLIEKLENLINKLLLHLGEIFSRALMKIIPAPVLRLFAKIMAAALWLKNLPMLIIKGLPTFIATAKSFAKGFDFKAKLKETHQLAMASYAKGQDQGSAKLSGLKSALLTPFLMLNEWIKGLSVAQTCVLLGFTAASVLAGVGVIYNSNKIITQYAKENRAPASVAVEEEITSDRPEYHKQQNRRFDMMGVRLPVFFSTLNQLRSIDVDFSADLSNRLARMKLEKLEFQLRDHLILEVEPMVAAFPLEEEGKDILKDKLRREIKDFMVTNGIEGEVKEVKLTYILAN